MSSLVAIRTSGALYAYCARVAGSVGAVMARLMGCEAPAHLLRAAELGVAMQLTNIARDVGQDARAGRLYLPMDELRAEGIEPDSFVAAPRCPQGLRVVIQRALDRADLLYARSERAIAALPADCRWAIWAARLIYADIGRVIRARQCDSVSARAVTSRGRKLALVARALGRARSRRLAKSAVDDRPALEQVRFLCC